MAVKRITASYVYTLADSEPIKNGFVQFDDQTGEILAVGACSAGEVVSEGALVPGFVNAHCHVELSHLHKKFV